MTGTGLAGAVSVSFGGAAVVPIVDSPTAIEATVPLAAVSGRIVVSVGGGGTARSARSFTVLPPPPTISSTA